MTVMPSESGGRRLVVVGASWGGLDAVGTVLADLDPDSSPPVAVAQHRADLGEDALARALQGRTRMRVVEAHDKAAIEPGAVYLAPPDYHLLVEDGHFALSLEPPVRYSRPSIDALFESAADVYGESVVAVLLTGANDDGTRGMRAVKRAGGLALVQDPSTAVRPEMPASAIAAGLADRVLGLPAIAAAINDLGAAV